MGESRISPTDTHSVTKYFLTKTISCYVTTYNPPVANPST